MKKACQEKHLQFFLTQLFVQPSAIIIILFLFFESRNIWKKKFNFNYYHIWREILGEKKPQKKQKTLNTDQFSVCDLISKVLPPPVVLL